MNFNYELGSHHLSRIHFLFTLSRLGSQMLNKMLCHFYILLFVLNCKESRHAIWQVSKIFTLIQIRELQPITWLVLSHLRLMIHILFTFLLHISYSCTWTLQFSLSYYGLANKILNCNLLSCSITFFNLTISQKLLNFSFLNFFESFFPQKNLQNKKIFP
jgi:hypothetical protein